MTALTDGLAALGARHDDTLSVCACWEVTFDRYAYHPTVVVPFETSLSEVEALARRRMLEALTVHGPGSTHAGEAEQWYAGRAAEVATLRVEAVTRRPEVTLDPRLG